MLTQVIPSTALTNVPAGRGCRNGGASACNRHACAVRAGCGGSPAGGLAIGSGRAGHGPLRVQFHQPPGLEGSGFDSRIRFGRCSSRDGFEGLYVHPALDAPALDAGGNTLLTEIDAFLSTLPPYSDERDQLSTALFGTSEILKVDPEGRVILTDSVKSHAAIADAVTFVGLGHKFQIWEPQAFRAHLEEARAKVRDLKRVRNSVRGTECRHFAGSAGAMTGRGDGLTGAAGGLARHVPVLLAEVLRSAGRSARRRLRRRHVRRGRLYAGDPRGRTQPTG